MKILITESIAEELVLDLREQGFEVEEYLGHTQEEIEQHIKEQPSIAVTYFLPDTKKAGGRYMTVTGNVKKLDELKCAIIMADKTKIPIADVRYIDGGLFRLYE